MNYQEFREAVAFGVSKGWVKFPYGMREFGEQLMRDYPPSKNGDTKAATPLELPGPKIPNQKNEKPRETGWTAVGESEL